jgi:hypothetical protein
MARSLLCIPCPSLAQKSETSHGRRTGKPAHEKVCPPGDRPQEIDRQDVLAEQEIGLHGAQKKQSKKN